METTLARPVIIGAGPAGLTAAYLLAKENRRPLVLEKSSTVGGLARTEVRNGYRVDIGGHRFFTKSELVKTLWREMLPEGWLRVKRLSRIYYRGRFLHYPLRAGNVLLHVGIGESLRFALSYASAHLHPLLPEDSLEKWMVNRFGRALFDAFFKSYTEKVWGMSCADISPDWASQRIRGLSFLSILKHALTGRHNTRTLVEEFDYPRLGPGMLWEACAERVKAMGGEVRFGCKVRTVSLSNDAFKSVKEIGYEQNGRILSIEAEEVYCSAPLSLLVAGLRPDAPLEVRAAAGRLLYRDFVIVMLRIARDKLFPDNWIYIQSPTVRVGRVQNFKNWSPDMVPEEGVTSLGMEYFCSIGDGLWTLTDGEFITLAGREAVELGLAARDEIMGGEVIRQPKAYPIYAPGHKDDLILIREYLAGIKNLYAIGRNGLHRYNNQDHSMLAAALAVENSVGASNDLWNVNADVAYHEEEEVEA